MEIEELQKAIEEGKNKMDAARQSLNDMSENLKKVTEEYEKKKVTFLKSVFVLLCNFIFIFTLSAERST